MKRKEYEVIKKHYEEKYDEMREVLEEELKDFIKGGGQGDLVLALALDGTWSTYMIGRGSYQPDNEGNPTLQLFREDMQGIVDRYGDEFSDYLAGESVEGYLGGEEYAKFVGWLRDQQAADERGEELKDLYYNTELWDKYADYDAEAYDKLKEEYLADYVCDIITLDLSNYTSEG